MFSKGATFRVIKRILYLTGLLCEETSGYYPKKSCKICLRADNVIIAKQLFLDPDLTITILAKEVGTNRTYLSKFFRLEKGSSFTDYINLLRAEYAKSLLCSVKKQPMADIAMMSGFGSVRALNRSFIKNFGVLPSRCRNDFLTAGSGLPPQTQKQGRTLGLK